MKKINIKYVLIMGGIFLILTIIFSLNILPTLSMKPTNTGKIDDTEIYAVKNKINSIYFIKSEDEYILVDSGSDKNAIQKTLNEINIDPLNVKYIFLTHSDYDHVSALSLFPNAKIYMSKNELKMINGTAKRNLSTINSLPKSIGENDIIWLLDKQELTIGNHKIICIDSVGHTLGSMSYLIDEKYLFTGDAFKVSNSSISVHPFSMDNETSKKTILKLKEISKDVKIILTAHYGWYESNRLKLG